MPINNGRQASTKHTYTARTAVNSLIALFASEKFDPNSFQHFDRLDFFSFRFSLLCLLRIEFYILIRVDWTECKKELWPCVKLFASIQAILWNKSNEKSTHTKCLSWADDDDEQTSAFQRPIFRCKWFYDFYLVLIVTVFQQQGEKWEKCRPKLTNYYVFRLSNLKWNLNSGCVQKYQNSSKSLATGDSIGWKQTNFNKKAIISDPKTDILNIWIYCRSVAGFDRRRDFIKSMRTIFI